MGVTREGVTEQIPLPQIGHYPLIDDFAQAVTEDLAPRFPGTDGIQATEMLDAIFESSTQGTWGPVR